MSAFTTEVRDGIAVVTFDLPGEPVNKLNAAVKVEFEALLIRVRDEAEIRAVVLISGKSDSFIAGADIEEFTALTTQAEAERLSFEGQEMVSRVETLPKPVVAAIHGACLGGGLELALGRGDRLRGLPPASADAHDGTVRRLVAILPETAREGAEVFFGEDCSPDGGS